MKLKDARGAYDIYTQSASNISRQASFAGIAVIWIFKNDNINSLSFPEELLYPALFFLLSLIFDLCQYVYSSAAWGILHRRREKKHGHNFDGDITVSRIINWPSNFFFWGKLVLLFLAYICLIKFLIVKIII